MLASVSHTRRALAIVLACQLTGPMQFRTFGNPMHPVVTQGTATFGSSGSHLTINTSDNTFINWSSFNIAPGQTTTFVEPSASSVVWNQINGSSPSQILGNLNANGYLVLQNQNGFVVGGQALIKADGLIMTTAPMTPPELSGSGAWSFTVPPPTAKIINYGRINLAEGGSAFLIADNIENDGSINAPEGNIGLYAGKNVLVSTRPDGRGLSARVTLPQGSVDNKGRLIADGGSISLQSHMVNQDGIIQANSVQNVNGTIELLASDSVNLGSSSSISAAGDSGVSDGGSVQISGQKAFTDKTGSTINVAGGAQGGNGGQVEIFGGNSGAILSEVVGRAATGYSGAQVSTVQNNVDITSGYIHSLTVDESSGVAQYTVQALNDIQLDTIWTLNDLGMPGLLTLSAGNNIIFNKTAGIRAVNIDPSGNPTVQNNWSVSLTAGTATTSPQPGSGSGGIYFLGNSFIQTYGGNITLNAASDVILNNAGDPNGWSPVKVTLPYPAPGQSVDVLNSGGSSASPPTCAIRTTHGGSITVTATDGNVYTGGNPYGYTFGLNSAPYYRVSTAQLGGISTAAGGDVTINAGGNVGGFLPQPNNNPVFYEFDGGTGAFGPNPGNVTINAGGSVSGNFVVANGAGNVTAQNGDVGSLTASLGCALNLVKGSWSVSAPQGNIFLQDIRNPNGLFNDAAGSTSGTANSAGYHYFDYGPMDSVSLTAAGAVAFTASGAPHSLPSTSVPFILPPSLTVSAGSGGFVLNVNVILFPSPDANLQITTQNGGSFLGKGNYLEMSDSAAAQYDPDATTAATFSPQDHAVTPPAINNPNPVKISISGNLEDITLYTTKETQITVGGNAFNANLVAQNLHVSDVSSVNVAGSISYSPTFEFANLSQPITSADPVVSSEWDTVFSLLVDPTKTAALALNGTESLATLDNDVTSLKFFPGNSNPFAYAASANPGFVYDAASHQLAYEYQMTPNVLNALTGPLEIIQENPHTGMPVLVPGNPSLGQNPSKFYFATTTVSFVPASVIQTLYTESQTSAARGNAAPPGFQIGGPGQLDITAASIDLGSSSGIISWGIGAGSSAARDYSDLDTLTPFEQGAAVNVNVSGNLTMLSSTIASVFGGNVTVNIGGELDLSQGHFNLPIDSGAPCYGIYTSGHSDVSVIGAGNINVGNSRIGAFNGGNVSIESTDGSVNAGFGANMALFVPVVYKDPSSGQLVAGHIGGDANNPLPYGSGILDISPTAAYSWTSKPLPGNITVDTPNGNITSATGGIDQFALDGSIAAGPTITLTAGTPASGHSPAIPGNIDLGSGGVIGGTVDLTAQGDISGLIVSHQDATIVAAQNINATVLAGGTANVTASGTIGGTVVGVGGVSASGSSITASLVSQNVSANGGASQSTLGTTAAATSTSQAAAQTSTAQAQQVASNDTSAQDDDKKKNKNRPVLARRVGRVTVVLPKAN